MEHFRKALSRAGESSSSSSTEQYRKRMSRALSAPAVKPVDDSDAIKSAAFAIRERVAARQRLVRASSVPDLSPRGLTRKPPIRVVQKQDIGDDDDDDDDDYEAPLNDKPRKSTTWFYDLHVPDSNQLTPVSQVSMDDWLFDLKASQQMLDHERSLLGQNEEEMLDALDCALQVGDFISIDTWMYDVEQKEGKGDKEEKKKNKEEKKKSKKKKKEKKEKKTSTKTEANESAEGGPLNREVAPKPQTQPDVNGRVDSVMASYMHTVSHAPTADGLVEFSCTTETAAGERHGSKRKSKGSDSSNSSSSRSTGRQHSSERRTRDECVGKESSSRRRRVHRQSSLPSISTTTTTTTTPSKEDRKKSSSRRRRRSSSRDLVTSQRQVREPILTVYGHHDEPHHEEIISCDFPKSTSSLRSSTGINSQRATPCSHLQESAVRGKEQCIKRHLSYRESTKTRDSEEQCLSRHQSYRESSTIRVKSRLVAADGSLATKKMHRSHRRSSM